MKIENNHPLPTSRTSESHIETIKKMKIGDSIFFDETSSVAECNFYNSAKVYAQGKDISFTGRKEENGVRVWRNS